MEGSNFDIKQEFEEMLILPNINDPTNVKAYAVLCKLNNIF